MVFCWLLSVHTPISFGVLLATFSHDLPPRQSPTTTRPPFQLSFFPFPPPTRNQTFFKSDQHLTTLPSLRPVGHLASSLPPSFFRSLQAIPLFGTHLLGTAPSFYPDSLFATGARASIIFFFLLLAPSLSFVLFSFLFSSWSSPPQSSSFVMIIFLESPGQHALKRKRTPFSRSP